MSNSSFPKARGASACIPYSKDVQRIVDYGNGILGVFVPYIWCDKNCFGWTAFPLNSIALVLLQFIVPVIAFSTVIPRRWHLDVADIYFDTRHSWPIALLKLTLSFFAVYLIASVDMILWITCIMSVAGPALFSAVEDALLDYLVVQELRKIPPGSRSPGLVKADRAELLVTILCGNVDIDDGRAQPIIRSSLIPTSLTDEGIQTLKSQLNSILNAQTGFGTAIGIPAFFFLGGFIYNVLAVEVNSATGVDWVHFAIFWMLLLFIAVISATLLAGNNPASLSVLIASRISSAKRPAPWWGLIKDYFEGELHPVSIWARGHTKWKWLQASNAVRQHIWLKNALQIGPLRWALITATTLVLVIFPTAIAFCWDFYVSYKQMGCRTLAYTVYIGSQVYLIFITLYLAATSQSYFEILVQKPRWYPQRSELGISSPSVQTIPRRAYNTVHSISWAISLSCCPSWPPSQASS